MRASGRFAQQFIQSRCLRLTWRGKRQSLENVYKRIGDYIPESAAGTRRASAAMTLADRFWCVGKRTTIERWCSALRAVHRLYAIRDVGHAILGHQVANHD